MNKELQNKAWSVLPKEFKEEVKKEYHRILNSSWRVSSYLRGRLRILREIFGLHNLTSDAEGEEALMCDRNTVRMLYDRADSVKVRQTLESLFGSKCLLDEVVVAENATTSESKPTEPKKESRNLSQETANCDKHFDNILNERRLKIAAMAMQGILSNHQLLKIALEAHKEETGSPDIYVAVAKTAKEQADALIAECEPTEK